MGKNHFTLQGIRNFKFVSSMATCPSDYGSKCMYTHIYVRISDEQSIIVELFSMYVESVFDKLPWTPSIITLTVINVYTSPAIPWFPSM